MLRIAAILFLLLLAARLVLRLLARWLLISRVQPEATSEERDPRQIRQLAECPTCGTFFEPERGLPRRTGEVPVCSEACRHGAPQSTEGMGSTDETESGSRADSQPGA